MNMSTTEKLITITELCTILEIGRNTAYHLLKTEQIKAFKIGSKWKIPLSSVNKYISNSIHFNQNPINN